VAYPILRLGDRGLLVRPLVRALEEAMIATCAAFGVESTRRDGHPGCWVMEEGRPARKIGALGIRIEAWGQLPRDRPERRPDLRDFELIDPCGMPGLVSTSIAEELGRTAEPPTTEVVQRAAQVFAAAFAAGLDATLDWRAAPALESSTSERSPVAVGSA
jgi:lipoyl(octanoyl) transferase